MLVFIEQSTFFNYSRKRKAELHENWDANLNLNGLLGNLNRTKLLKMSLLILVLILQCCHSLILSQILILDKAAGQQGGAVVCTARRSWVQFHHHQIGSIIRSGCSWWNWSQLSTKCSLSQLIYDLTNNLWLWSHLKTGNVLSSWNIKM